MGGGGGSCVCLSVCVCVFLPHDTETRHINQLINPPLPNPQTTNTPLQKVFATGFYEELDFSNEAKNQVKMKELLADSPGIYIPKVRKDL